MQAGAGTYLPYTAVMATEEVNLMQSIPLQKTESIRVVYQINQDEWKGDVGKGLFYLQKLLQTYQEQRIPVENVDLHGVFHGAAGYWMLRDEAYDSFKKSKQGNPNRKLIQELTQKGVHLELCVSTMKEHGWPPEQILPEVQLVVGAYPRVIDLQLQGYAYIKF